MLTPTIPPSFATLLATFQSCFTAPTYRTFTAMAAGLLGQPGRCTITGMLAGIRLAGVWHHARAHRFFAAARWSPDRLGLAVLEVIVALLVDPAAPLLVVVDDSLFKRRGRKVFGAAMHYDPTATGRRRSAWGNNWVVVGILVQLPCVPHRQVCLPVLARLWRPHHPEATKQHLARALLERIACCYPERRVHVICDGAFIGKTMRSLPDQVTITARLRADAALYALPAPRRPGQRGRPRCKGERLPELIWLAGLVATPFIPGKVRCYAKTSTLDLASLRCLWYGVLGAQPVQVVMARPPTWPDGYQLAIVTTDLAATPIELVERYALRWNIEVTLEEARQVLGVGQARNRTRRAVARTVPFGLVCYSLLVVWYAQHGQPAADVAAHRARAPWYRTKQAVSVADMLTAFRRHLLAAQLQASPQVTPGLEQLLGPQVTWATPAA
jgi:DDE superfamily endonuclease